MAHKTFGFETNRKRLGTVPFSANVRQELDSRVGIPKDYFIYAFLLRLRYRVAVSGGTVSGTVVAEAGQNLIERLEISGQHKIFGDWVRLLLQGSHLYQMGSIVAGFPFERSLGGLAGAVGNYDVSVSIYVPLVPPRIRPEEQLMYLLDAPLWNSLQLYVDWGGIGTPISGGDRTVAIQGFGGTGNPELVVHRIVAKLRGDRFNLNPIPVKQTYKEKLLDTAIADGLVTDINVGNFLRSLFLITGVQATGASAARVGRNFLTLSDAIYSRVKIKKDDVASHDVDWIANQQIEAARKQLGFAWPSGYNAFDFAEDDTIVSAFDTREIALQKLRLELQGDTTGLANQYLHIPHWETAGIPVFQDER